MKKLGLIGGIGPESTILYYRKLVYAIQQRVSPDFFPPIIIESLNVFSVLRFCEAENYHGLIDYLMTGIHNLIRGGAEVIALTGNTPHIVFNQLQAASSVPLISIVDATCTMAKNHQLERVGLLGTAITMQADFFKQPFLNQQIQIFTPNRQQQSYVNQKIHNELERGIILPDTQQKFLDLVLSMQQEYQIQAIILACTELPLLFKNLSLPIPVLDTLEIHVNTLIDSVFSE